MVRFLLTKDSVHLSYNGKHVNLTKNDKRFPEVCELIKQNKLDEIAEVMDRKEKAVDEYIEGSGLTLIGGQLRDNDGNALPAVLSTRLQELKQDGFPVTSLVNFWNNLKQNPSMNSREQLFKFMEQNGHPLTEDGHFIAYRGISRNFKDKHTGTFDNSPGSVCEMQRRDVDDDPNKTCSRGLHVAAYSYANGFGEITVEVKVNPRDVVAVPTDYSGQKMRVCRFEVVQVCERENKSTVYGYDSSARYWDNYDWDDDEDEVEDEVVEEICALAADFKTMYKDRSSLATRVHEDLYGDLTVAEVLEILNDNEGNW